MPPIASWQPLQSALHRFARPWYRMRALHVFRDQSNLSTSPALWSSVQQALLDSEFFILLASPGAAASKWVNKEVNFWLSHRSPKTLLLVLTGGNVIWNDATGDFDWDKTDAIPRELRKIFQEEPFVLDLRGAKTPADLSLKNPGFLESIATLAATLHGRAKDELIGQDVSQHRLVRRLVWSTLAVLSILTLLLAGAAWVALQQRTLAVSRELAATSLTQVAGNPDLGISLAVEAVNVSPTEQAIEALRDTLIRAAVYRELKELITTTRSASYAGQSSEFVKELTSRSGRFRLYSADGKLLEIADAAGKQVSRFSRHMALVSSADLSPEESLIVSVDEDGFGYVWETQSGRSVTQFSTGARNKGYSRAVWSPDGEYVVIGAAAEHTATILKKPSWRSTITFDSHSGAVNLIAITLDGKFVLTGSTSETYVAQERSAYIWHPETGTTVAQLADAGRQVDSLAFSGDGAAALAVYGDGFVRMWSSKTGVPILTVDGDELRTSSALDQRVLTFEAASPRLDGTGVTEIVKVLFSRDGRALGTLDDEDYVRAWQVETLAELTSVPPDIEEQIRTAGGTESTSPDRMRIAIAAGRDVRIQRKEASAPLNELLALAKIRIQKPLSPEDRARFVP
jgi:hypothetical protein